MKKLFILGLLLMLAIPCFAETVWIKPSVVLDEIVPPTPFDLDLAALKAEVLALDSFTFNDIKFLISKHGGAGTNAQAKEVIRRLEEANKFITYEALYAIQYPSAKEPLEP